MLWWDLICCLCDVVGAVGPSTPVGGTSHPVGTRLSFVLRFYNANEEEGGRLRSIVVPNGE